MTQLEDLLFGLIKTDVTARLQNVLYINKSQSIWL